MWNVICVLVCCLSSCVLYWIANEIKKSINFALGRNDLFSHCNRFTFSLQYKCSQNENSEQRMDWAWAEAVAQHTLPFTAILSPRSPPLALSNGAVIYGFEPHELFVQPRILTEVALIRNVRVYLESLILSDCLSPHAYIFSVSFIVIHSRHRRLRFRVIFIACETLRDFASKFVHGCDVHRVLLYIGHLSIQPMNACIFGIWWTEKSKIWTFV